jgi:hypothetical protein
MKHAVNEVRQDWNGTVIVRIGSVARVGNRDQKLLLPR